MNKEQQYVIQKYVMAESAEQAMKKSKKLPIHEVFISSTWQEKVANGTFFREDVSRAPGFGLSTPKEKVDK